MSMASEEYLAPKIKKHKPMKEEEYEPIKARDADGIEHTYNNGVHIFTASWCGHCKTMKADNKAYFQNMHKIHNELKVLGVPFECHEDDDDNPSLCIPTIFNVEGYPTILYVEDGEKVKPLTESRNLDDIAEDYLEHAHASRLKQHRATQQPAYH
jgi:thiol-disulfide isomerase/thioredoxin